MGKGTTILLKQIGANLPADLAGAHYYEYDSGRLERSKKVVAGALKSWRTQNRVNQIIALRK